MRAALVFLFVCLCSTGQSQVASQSAPASTDQVPIIRATAGEVLLDMVVRDKHHKLVNDLQPGDVQVFEDGVRQDIKGFRLVSGGEQLQSERGDVTAAKSGDPTAPAPKKLRELNFVSIVFAPTAPLNREFAREAVMEFLKSDSLPNTFITIYSMANRLTLVQPYTTNKSLLTAAVDKVSKTLSVKGGSEIGTALSSSAITTTLSNAATAGANTTPPTTNPDPMMGQFSGAVATSPLWARNTAAQDASTNLGAAMEAQSLLAMSLLRFDSNEAMQTVDSLRELVRSQAKIPGRKVVLYLSDGIAFPPERREIVENLISLSNRLGVTFYTVDTRGLSVEDSTLPGMASLETVGAESRQRGAVTTANPVSGHKEMDDLQSGLASNRQQSMQELADATGGFAVINTNQIADPMQRVMEDIRTHYELSYSPKSTLNDGHFRKIEVRLTRPKLSVQTRKGYYALPMLNGEPLQAFEAAAIDKINLRPAPKDFPYDSSVLKFRTGPDAAEYMIAFEIPVSSLKAVPVPKSDKTRVEASMVALIRDDKGEVINRISRQIWRDMTASANSAAMEPIVYTEPLILPRGKHTIDIAVTDEQSGAASVRRVAVPVDAGDGLRLSSITLVNRAEPLAGARNPLNELELDNARIVPELGDSISSAGPVSLYFVVYPVKNASVPTPNVTLELLRDGTEIARQPLHVPEARSDGAIPMIARITPGQGSFAVIITAQQGNLAAQAVRSIQIQ